MKISVVIPCYNDGEFLPDAVESVLACSNYDIELIIVNDGSSDALTLNLLAKYEQQGIKVLSHTNKGLGYTRNAGIRAATGKYILPLDADNKVKQEYFDEAIPLLEAGICDIVYAKPSFFGNHIPEKQFNTHNFKGFDLFFTNYIDACAIYNKYVWEKTSGYDENMPFQGNEDWEFWLNSFLAGFKFKYIDKELFDYRIRPNSMIANIIAGKGKANHDYMIMKHKDHFLNQSYVHYRDHQFYENDQKNLLRTSVKYFVKALKKLISN